MRKEPIMHGRPWTTKQKSYLKKQWGKTKIKNIAWYLKRTEGAVREEGKRLGLPKVYEWNRWNDNDLKTLEKDYNKIPLEELQAKLESEKSIGAIQQRACSMGITSKKIRTRYTGPNVLNIIIERQREAGVLT